MAELLTSYASLRLQVVDACVVALAERLDLHEVATLDAATSRWSHHATCPRGELDQLGRFQQLTRKSEVGDPDRTQPARMKMSDLNVKISAGQT
jgi:hypothetical protein